MEQLPSLDEIRARISELEMSGCDEEDLVTGQIRTLSERIEKLRRRELWRQTRRSLPRCLRCGSSSVRAIENIDGFTHPGCGGPLYSLVSLGGSVEASFPAYTPEGERLDEPLPRELGMRSALE
jgi:hypothetical protein